MKLYAFGRDVASPMSAHGSRQAAFSRIARIEGRVQMGVVHLDAGGSVGRHPALVNQLFLVVAGEGWVSGDGGGSAPIRPGLAAFWEAGEEHAAGTESGLIAVVVEAAALNPEAFMTTA